MAMQAVHCAVAARGLVGLHSAQPRVVRVCRPRLCTAPLRGRRPLCPPRCVASPLAPSLAAASAHGDQHRLASGQEASWAHGQPLCGRADPMGATLDPHSGVTNFALFASNAWGVTLCLFSEADLRAGRVTLEVPLAPEANRTGDVWHIALPGLDPSLLYGYRVYGSNDEQHEDSEGQRHDPARVVLDPYSQVIVNGRQRWGEMGPDLAYKTPGVLGYAATWPQAAAALPQPGAQFDWEGDRPLGLAMEDLVIYEMHVRGFTQHSSSGVTAPGTFQGVIERLDYLQALGVNAIELMPVHEFNELEYYQVIPGSDSYRYNFWGYSTVGFFAPMARFSAAAARGEGGGAVLNEFKQLVKECHRRGIEVIMDVVFNHTAEGNEQGPTLSFRGLDNRVYYMLAPGGECYNYSGCGNTMNCNHPVVRQFIVDCLRYWVQEMHVDGFRFDLGSIMTRAPSMWHPCDPVPPAAYASDSEDAATAAAAALAAAAAAEAAASPGTPQPFESESDAEGWLSDSDAEAGGGYAAVKSKGAIVCEAGFMTDGAGVPTGTPLADPPLIEMISADPVLKDTKMIAEAWDCDGLNQVGAFPHYGRWSEWNGHFRDTVRQFAKGTDGPWVGNMASVLCGSPHIYVAEPGENDWWGSNSGRRWKGGRGPTASVNFVTAHDGFTLADLVAYNEKHNEANGEDNRDGEAHNLSWNCGEEGPSTSPAVNSLRQRQMRNMMTALLVAHGVPMLFMGDEYGHSKGGNNNTYCHDSPLNYLDWHKAAADDDGLLRFTRHMISLRHKHKELRRSSWINDSEVQWHGTEPAKPDWTEASRFLAYTLGKPGGGGLYIAFNSSHLPQVVQLPRWPGRVWQLVADTSKVAPFDVLVADDQLPEEEVAAQRASMDMWKLEHCYPMLPWSSVVLESVPEAAKSAMPQHRKQGSGTGF
ncbi:hypothetical protein D9Q98_001728 [Chlorella vulgaris]|uniref:Glycosyl hydrolase family 13 catalytic domain-containing protein n=1 Tax=Chlorella vulgaris TaxID=3077 RepID=A0A9D4TUV7_CHLVU|nr:hypothetical protein D9Q98_001728 [Chlorella vulgaris]